MAMVTHRFLAATAVLLAAAAPIAAPAQTAQKKFDARDPASLIDFLAATDAKAEVVRKNEDEVHLSVSTSGLAFGAQFAGCEANGKVCKALAFTAASEKRGATLAQVNGFNQTSLRCRVYQEKAGKMNGGFATLAGARVTREDLRMHMCDWQTRLGASGQYMLDPSA